MTACGAASGACLAMAAGITLVISTVFYNAAEPLFRLFSQDDAVVAVGVGMMHVLTPVYITYICIEVLAGALRGCGDVRIPTLITVFFCLRPADALAVHRRAAASRSSHGGAELPHHMDAGLAVVYCVLQQGQLAAALCGEAGKGIGFCGSPWGPRALPIDGILWVTCLSSVICGDSFPPQGEALRTSTKIPPSEQRICSDGGLFTA